jgi:DNA transformation protein and related proteins
MPCAIRSTGSASATSAGAKFGGHGLDWRGVSFGISHRERPYLKVDERSRPAFEAVGMGPFRTNGRQTLKSYYEMPTIAIGDPEALLSRDREANRAARSSPIPG